MKTLEEIQFDIFKLNRKSIEQIGDAIVELTQASGNPDLLIIYKKIIKEDIKTLHRIRHELRNLSIMQSFYDSTLKTEVKKSGK